MSPVHAERKVDFRGEICFDSRNHSGEHLHTKEMWVDLYLDYKINDNLMVKTMLENHGGHNEDVDNYTRFENVYIEANFGKWNVVLGRYGEYTTNEAIMDRNVEQVRVTYGNSSKLFAWAGQRGNFTDDLNDRIFVLGFQKDLKGTQVRSQYWKYSDQKIFNLGFTRNFAKRWEVSVEYMRGVENKNGYVASIQCGKLDTEIQGSWKVWAKYFEQPREVYLFPTYDCNWFMDNEGYKGPGVGIDFVPIKKTSASLYYFDVKSQDGRKKDRIIYTELYYYF